MLKTFRQVREFNQAVNSFTNRDPENANTKLGYALKKISETQIKKIVKDYQEEYNGLYYDNVQRKQVDHALTDKSNGALLNAPKGSERPFLYDKLGLLAVMEAEKNFGSQAEALLEKWDLKEYEITPHYAVEVPEGLLDNERSAFLDFVIKKEEKEAVAA